MKLKHQKRKAWVTVAIMCLVVFMISSFVTLGSATAPEQDGIQVGNDTEITQVTATVTVDGESTSYDFSKDIYDEEFEGNDAKDYVDNYKVNVNHDPNFKQNLDTALAKVREEIPFFATIWSLLPPILAIVLALITKEVYSSLFIGILAGGLIYSNFGLESTITHVFSDGFVGSVADSYNVGILIFLVMLGAMVAMMNKAGGSAAFGRWATKHIKSRVGAQLATIALGILIFVDDYFNCLTVGSVMRPITDKQNISRSKLAYVIDSTAAPICIIAPISSWAAAVSGFATDAGAENGMSLFIHAIPYNFYALLTITMLIFLAVTGFDYGPMKKHEDNAKNGDIFSEGVQESIEALPENPRGRVCDLIVPVIFLVVSCVIGMIYSGGFFSGENFIDAFSNSDASVGLLYGSFIATIFTIIFFICRRVLSFKNCMDSIPEGFKAMVPAIMILICAWTLKAMTDSIGANVFIADFIQSSAQSLQNVLPAIIFLVAVGLSFATGTSWGTFGILIPIVLSVFNQGGEIAIIAISACMAGAVCGDHCSPISDTTIMASAGGQCNHINHVSTQLPYALTVAGVSFVCYLIAGFIRNWIIMLPVSFALIIGTLFVLKLTIGQKKVKS